MEIKHLLKEVEPGNLMVLKPLKYNATTYEVGSIIQAFNSELYTFYKDSGQLFGTEEDGYFVVDGAGS